MMKNKKLTILYILVWPNVEEVLFFSKTDFTYYWTLNKWDDVLIYDL